MKVGFITLGCDKNTVDSERYLAQLASYGGEHTEDLHDADVIIVNTCGFIDAAKKESIDALVEAGQYKVDGACQAVVAVGCMVERHKGELAEALPEVDLFVGTSETDTLVKTLSDRGLLGPDALLEHPGVRLYTGNLPHVRYLKISEGCDHGCAFCAIPLMRGKHRSFALDEVIREAQLLELQGAREVNLVAQDLAHYGRDFRVLNGTAEGGEEEAQEQRRGPSRRVEQIRLPDLLEALVRDTTVPWIRMMYLYSAGITPRLLEVVAREPRIVPYLDMPIQHASDTVLARMRRPERQATIREKVARFREAVPDVAIRTTCIVGFPGETSGDFEQLSEFLESVQFERVGAFTYSPQEGTRAAQLDDDVPDAVKLERLEQLTDLQRIITAERYEQRLGRSWRALVDTADPDTGLSIARLPWQADDIDGVAYLDDSLPPGTLVEVMANEVIDDYDFHASIIEIVDAPAQPAAAVVHRQLPLLSTTVGSFGK